MRKLLFLAALFLVSFGVAEPSFAQTGTVVATVRPNPLKVEISDPGTVAVGQWFEITASVSNHGSETIQKTTATLNTPTEIVVRGKNKKLGNLGPGGTKTVSWQAKANSAGTFVILAEVTGNLAGEIILATDTTLISADLSTSSLVTRLRYLIFGG